MRFMIGVKQKQKLKTVICELLESQMGEITKKVQIDFKEDCINFTADCIISPAEQIMMQNDKNRNLFLFYKIKQYNIVKDNFMQKIENIIKYKIVDTSTHFSEDGTRTITMWTGSRFK